MWAISLPLVVVSWFGAHCLAYWLVSLGAEHRAGVHAAHGHAYLGYSPAVGIWLLALVLGGLVLCVGEGLRGRRPSRPPVRLFAVLPPVGFTVQEHLERLIGSGAIPHDLVLEPTFIVGLALQLPFALAALLVALALQALGCGLGGTVARELAFRRAVRHTPRLVSSVRSPARRSSPSVLALGHGPRAPPAAASP